MRFSMFMLATGAFLLGACGTSEEPATTYLDEYASHVSALKTSLKAHGDQIAGAANMQAMSTIEQSHMDGVNGDLDGMGQNVDMMAMCTNAQGGMLDTAMMGPLVEQARAECARHEDAMKNAADTNAARIEEDAHQAAMGAMLGKMMQMDDQAMGGSMMGGSMMSSGDYMCPMMTAR